MAGFLDALGALNNQGVFAGLGAMGNGMYTGQGAGGYAPGAQQYLMGQQQLQAARLQNMFQQAMMPTKLGLLQSASGAMQNSPAAGGAGAALGAPGAVGGPGGPAAPGPQGGGMLNSASPMLPASELHALAMYAAASGDTRGAANLLNQIEQRAGGAGYNLDASGGAYATPGGAKDPRVLGQNSLMEEAGKQGALTAPGATANLQYLQQKSYGDAAGSALGAMAPGGRNDPRTVYQENLARSAGTGAGGAPYEAPVPIEAAGPDGVVRQQFIPRSQLPSVNNFGPPQPMSPTDWVAKQAQLEGTSSNPNTRNMMPGQTAFGPLQFTQPTFVPRARAAAPEATAGMSDADVQKLAADPSFASQVNVPLMQDNAKALQAAGLPVTSTSLSVAHTLGPGGAVKALTADPRTPLASVLSPDAIRANPGFRNATVGDFVAGRARVMGNAPVQFPSGPQPAIPGAIVGKASPTQEQAQAAEKLGGRSGEIMEAGAKAPQAMVQLNTLQTALDQYRTGSDAQTRQQAGKSWLSALGTLGFTPSKELQDRVAAGETIDKISGMLTTEIARSMGSREAASVVNSIAQRMPSLDKSPQGNQVLVGALRQGLQRDQDLAQFREQWLADPRHGGSIQGMESQFNRVHPSEVYSSKALPLSVPSNKQQLTLGALYKGPGGHVGMWNGQGFDTDQANWGVR